jgi:hypothetical protein
MRRSSSSTLNGLQLDTASAFFSRRLDVTPRPSHTSAKLSPSGPITPKHTTLLVLLSMESADRPTPPENMAKQCVLASDNVSRFLNHFELALHDRNNSASSSVDSSAK